MDPGSHVGFQMVEDHPMNISGKFGWNLFSSFREEDLNVKSQRTDGRTTDAYPWQKLTWPMARWAQNQPLRNKNRLWQPCLLTDQDEMSNLYREPAIDASYQLLIHLTKQFQRRRFLTRGSQEPVIAHLVFNLTSKVDRKCRCYT